MLSEIIAVLLLDEGDAPRQRVVDSLRQHGQREEHEERLQRQHEDVDEPRVSLVLSRAMVVQSRVEARDGQVAVVVQFVEEDAGGGGGDEEDGGQRL